MKTTNVTIIDRIIGYFRMAKYRARFERERVARRQAMAELRAVRNTSPFIR